MPSLNLSTFMQIPEITAQTYDHKWSVAFTSLTRTCCMGQQRHCCSDYEAAFISRSISSAFTCCAAGCSSTVVVLSRISKRLKSSLVKAIDWCKRKAEGRFKIYKVLLVLLGPHLKLDAKGRFIISQYLIRKGKRK